ncbi:MAG: DUF192 domain-containing protein [Candidatus Aenigmatarchaeota archaeon]
MEIRLKNSTIEADVADSFLKQLLGLSFSKKKNMLFIMPYEKRWSFWMFLVRYPLKFIFLDSSKKVVDIKEGKPISLGLKTWKTYKSKEACKYVLETPFSLKIKVGDKLKW